MSRDASLRAGAVSSDAPRIMTSSWLECSTCHEQVALASLGPCQTCGGVLEVAYAAIRDRDASVIDAPRHGSGIWRWRGLLPVLNDARGQISLAEGDTPLLPADDIGPDVWLKYEGKNPTHSFKDRFQAVAISAALALGKTRVVCASTGNHGVAAAAYSALGRLRCAVLTHEEAPAAHVEAWEVPGCGVSIEAPRSTRVLRPP